jgi:hypothetical protein
MSIRTSHGDNKEVVSLWDEMLTDQQLRSAHTHTRTCINGITTPYKGCRLACRNEWPQVVLLILVVAGTKGNAAG